MRTAVALLVVALAGAPLAGQTGQPQPGGASLVPLPAFELRTLSNGAELIVVTLREQPFVTVNLAIRGGSSADPARLAGLAEMTAELLTEATRSLQPGEVAEAVEALGAQLTASAGPDYTTVSLGARTADLDAAVALMADVVLSPALPADELARRTLRAGQALELQSGSLAFQASLAFTRALYAQHPYGKIQSPETLGRIDVQDVLRHHRDFYRPNNAVFVVAGDVEADAVVERLDRHFADWSDAQISLPTYYGLPTRSGPEVTVVHVPGAPRAAVRLGHTMPPGDHADWAAMQVVNLLLGGTGAAPFDRATAPLALDGGASSTLTRRKDVGFLQVRAEGSADVADSAVATILTEMERLRTTPPEQAELEAVKRHLTDSYPLSMETPQQIANLVTNHLLLGQDRDAMEGYSDDVMALTPAQVREAAERHLHPDSVVIVVAGDAVALGGTMARFGPVTVVDRNGHALSPEDLDEAHAPPRLDGSRLVPGEWTYSVQAQDWPVGEVTRSLVPGPGEGSLVFTSDSEIGPRRITRSVSFLADGFEAVSSEDRLVVEGRELYAGLAIEDGRVSGRIRGPGGEQPVTGDAIRGALLGEMAELALWISDLESGQELILPVVAQDGRVTDVTIRVGGIREVEVPAGTFEAWEVELEGAGSHQKIYVRVEEPHYTVMIELQNQPVVTRLTRVRVGAPGR